MMRNCKAFVLGIGSALLFSCSNDDDQGSTPIPAPLPEGVVVVSGISNTWELNLADGSVSDGPDDYAMTSTATSGSRLFYADQVNGEVNGFDTATGLPLWNISPEVPVGERLDMIRSRIAVLGSTVFVSYTLVNTTDFTSRYFLTSLHANTGLEIETIEVDAEIELMEVSGSDLYVYRRNRDTGEVSLERRNTETLLTEGDPVTVEVAFNLALVNDQPVLNIGNQKVIGFTEALLPAWQFDTGDINNVGLFANGNNLYMTSRDGNLYNINPLNGTENWSRPLLSNLGQVVLANAQGPVWWDLNTEGDLIIYAYDTSGNERWTRTLPLGSVSDFPQSLAVEVSGYILFTVGAEVEGQGLFQVYLLDAVTGATVWDETLEAGLGLQQLVTVSNGTIQTAKRN